MRSVRSLTYGITSSLELVNTDGRLVVLRSYDTAERTAAAERAIQNEVRALAAGRGVLGGLVPELVAADPLGVESGCPSLLMTYVPGRPLMAEVDTEQLAEVLVALHSGPVPSHLPAATSWFDRSRLAVPSWTEHPESWSKLLTMLEQPAPSAASVFLHRDFHHGNVLWADGRISGVVDWPSACRGSRDIDVAHTRTNLALVSSVETADRFLAAYAARVGRHHQDAWWDAAGLVGLAQDFSGVLAFNAFGAGLDAALLARNADSFARAICRSI